MDTAKAAFGSSNFGASPVAILYMISPNSIGNRFIKLQVPSYPNLGVHSRPKHSLGVTIVLRSMGPTKLFLLSKRLALARPLSNTAVGCAGSHTTFPAQPVLGPTPPAMNFFSSRV